MDENSIAKNIVNIAFNIHKILGPGLLESVYENVLCHELELHGLAYDRQKSISIRYKNLFIEDAFRADIIVCNKVIIELKSLETVKPVHGKQLLTYLRLLDIRLGLLINFGASLFKHGITRVANNLKE